ncbi:MAG: 2-C-methyl-D-erythritol 4-phosphate cytidylyltransferase [Candidatus Marinimicrobia bacterium]|nr:2-C-methyl-D-erythritol 4-phosphate cytidylyltransferase [Candidatus Neomarinimicrobiota bacterium]MBL7046749.1 2-C-methyl-D-erythritol 4-phosphate cytidylyltransferase [Candidatus Neomarinimicrobiota bacterium]
MQVAAVIPGAGKSLRFSQQSKVGDISLPKQFRTLAQQPLIIWTLHLFVDAEIITQIVVVVPEDYVIWMQGWIDVMETKKEILVTAGGEKRQDSVKNGLEKVRNDMDVVVVHDAVRPFIRERWILETVDLCSDYDGAIVAIRARDTMKKVESGIVEKTLDRSHIWQAQTPQTFKKNKLVSAYENAGKRKIIGTDEAQLVELNGGRVAVIEGDPDNIKITTPVDWTLAEKIWERKYRD